ncbi:MAG TPA: glycosyltransferase [Gemmatimonadaceae bacterium]|nr:glycosyltransferase [Gemmatimonadaceae bacterium]
MATAEGSAPALHETVVAERVLRGSARAEFVVRTAIAVAAMLVVAWRWLTLPGALAYPAVYLLASALLAFHAASWFARWLGLDAMRRPRPMAPEPGLRVGVATSFVPAAESLDMLERTVRALVAMDYPHETWVLDEGDDPAVRALCEQLGAHHFSRKEMPQYQEESGTFQRHSKHGNYNAWLAEIGYARYDVISAFDADHVPERDFLTHVLGYFRDPAIGYVQAPQVYYNQDASFIARGAAEETYAYYSTHQMASYGLGQPIIVGSHNTHRVEALRSVGGFAAHDADDLLITLYYRARGWKGVYVPEILAMGLTPVDWHGYLRQQVRWARSVVDIKLRALPGMSRRLPIVERLLGLLHGAFYLRALTIPAAYAIVAYLAIVDGDPAIARPSTVAWLLGLALVLTLVGRFRQRYFLDPAREGGVHWRSLFLQLAKWPFFGLALWRALVGRQGTYTLTWKRHRPDRQPTLMWPHWLVAILMAEAWLVGRVVNGGVPRMVTLATAAIILLSAIIGWTERWHFPHPYEASWYPERRAEMGGE